MPHPLAEYDWEDWITLVTFSDGTSKRYGTSPHVEEKDVLPMVMNLLPTERSSQIVDVKTMRRSDYAKMKSYDKVQA